MITDATMTVTQLREELRGRGLQASGRKAELLARLGGPGTTAAAPRAAATGGDDGGGGRADCAGMTVARLRHELRGRGLPAGGRKAELIARLASSSR